MVYNSIKSPNTHMAIFDQKTYEKYLALATLWTAAAGAFLIVVIANS